jgi:hypothetical protein
MYDRFVVPSPAVYWAPVEVTDAELLAQSIALPLLSHVLAQASEQYQIDSAWQPLVSGLYLWQAWDLDLPLAAWREEVVTWLYADEPAIPPGHPVVLPERYTALCAAHTLWMQHPIQIEIPLWCTELDRKWYHLSVYSHNPPMRLTQLGFPVPAYEYVYAHGELHRKNHPGQTVALATLVEYAVATYGRERLPVLVAGLGHYESWDTLLPAVFGVSPAEFEAGWQTYLAAHYGISAR